MDERIEIVLLDIASADEQVKIHQAAFGEEGIKVGKEYWVKKHYQNPLGTSLIFGASINGAIVGINAYMPMEYYYNGETHFFLQSCESGVLPQYQGKGIWGKIVRYAIDYIANNTKYEAVIGFPNYDKSYPGFKKMGWLTINDMENYVMVNNASSFSKVFSPDNAIKRFLAHGIYFERVLLQVGSGFIVTPCDIDSLLWHNEKDCVIRSHQADLIKWKVDYLGSKLIAVKKGDEVVATCIYHLDKYNEGTIIKVEKIVAGNSDCLRKALVSVLKYFYKVHPDAAFVRFWLTKDSVLRPVLKKLLFMKSLHKNPFIISNQETVLFDKYWDLSFYDLD